MKSQDEFSNIDANTALVIVDVILNICNVGQWPTLNFMAFVGTLVETYCDETKNNPVVMFKILTGIAKDFKQEKEGGETS